MGQLDDAIREHLELKRRHGAADAEVERLEQEALGPVRGAPTRDVGEAEPDPVPARQDAPVEAAAPAPTDAETAPATVAAPEEGAAPAPPPTREPEPFDTEGHGSQRVEGSRSEEPERVDPEVGGLRRIEESPPEDPPRAPAAEPTAPAGDVWLDESELSEPPETDPDQRTTEFTPEGVEPRTDRHDLVPADEEPGAEDVLEETPEFLQETPEHDRLWFEQRPPRDFDFDK